MEHYCFNPDCDYWGDNPYEVEGIPVGTTLDLKSNDVIKGGCFGCGGDLIPHDNWKGERMLNSD